jgi:hypothetical protein
MLSAQKPEAELDTVPPAWTLVSALEKLLRQVAIIAVAAAILLRLPLPIFDEYLALRDVIIVAAAIMLMGKAVFDTLFYDRYWPHSAPGRK